ncbi:uncharacterized protein An08g08050 [Aspergillus niger]|uniref:Contig An08c0210, genomic contig n=2 Tax=Aspergillus niger TaxID=5061 RepID=A2QS24_ASPNC|nr:uncharacterized protein An08g08050 [Aspergillus niger]CAK45696.1 unnamed protein product [Aspergillus niger]
MAQLRVSNYASNELYNTYFNSPLRRSYVSSRLSKLTSRRKDRSDNVAAIPPPFVDKYRAREARAADSLEVWRDGSYRRLSVTDCGESGGAINDWRTWCDAEGVPSPVGVTGGTSGALSETDEGIEWVEDFWELPPPARPNRAIPVPAPVPVGNPLLTQAIAMDEQITPFGASTVRLRTLLCDRDQERVGIATSIEGLRSQELIKAPDRRATYDFIHGGWIHAARSPDIIYAFNNKRNLIGLDLRVKNTRGVIVLPTRMPAGLNQVGYPVGLMRPIDERARITKQ